MQIATLPPRHKICIFALGLMSMSWIFATVVLFPAQQRIVEMENELRTERTKNLVVQDFGMTHPEPAKYLKSLNAKLTSFERLLPPDALVSDFLSQSEAAANASGVQLLSLKPGAVVNKNGFREWTIELMVRGGYFQTMNFIKKLEEGQRFNAITNAVLQSKSGQLESKLAVSIYIYGNAAPPTASNDQKAK